MKQNFKIIFSVLILVSTQIAWGQQIEVGIDEKLGDTLPLDTEFIDVKGDTVTLRDLIDKPVLLSFVYYGCPGICSPLTSELVDVVNHIKMEPGEDFKLITLSFNHHEDTATAKLWKDRHLGMVKRNFKEADWNFLTGDSVNIRKVTDAAGFYFKPNGVDFIHAGAVIAVSPDGKISRYLFGTTFNPFDVQMALIDAKSGKTNPTISKVLQFCFSYDPDGRKYSLNITRIIGTVMLMTVGIFFGVLVLKKKTKKGV